MPQPSASQTTLPSDNNLDQWKWDILGWVTGSTRYLNIKWHPGQENLADYQSKHHIGSHRIGVRPWYLHKINSPLVLPRAKRPSTLKGCVGNLPEGYIWNVPLPRIPWNQSTVQSRVPPIHTLPVYYKKTHIIFMYNSTCRIGERVAQQTLPNGNLLPLILRTFFCLISMASLMPSLHSQQRIQHQIGINKILERNWCLSSYIMLHHCQTDLTM